MSKHDTLRERLRKLRYAGSVPPGLSSSPGPLLYEYEIAAILPIVEDELAARDAEIRHQVLEQVTNEIGLYAAKYMQSRTPRVEIANEILKKLRALLESKVAK